MPVDNTPDDGGTPGRVDPSAQLPPELDPRGRRAARGSASEAARARQRAAAAAGTSGRRVRVGGRKDALRGAVLGGRIAAAAVSLLVVVGSGYVWATYNDFQSNIARVQAIPSQSTSSKPDIDGKAQNILIVGNDDRSNATPAELAQLGTTQDGGSLNTDTMMLMHVPANGAQATIISFPRDSYVAIPGHGMNKLNAAYPEGVADDNGNKSGGSRLLVQTIENLTGLTIDHFVQVDLLGFYRISNAIGGVTVCLNEAQKEPNSGIDLPKGTSTIKGKQALAFVRQRYGFPDGLGDLDRIKRQQYFLSAVFRKMSSSGVLLNPFKLQALLTAVVKSLTLDTTFDPLKFAQQMQNLQAGNFRFLTIPTDGFANEDVGSVVVVHPDDVKDTVLNMVNPPAAVFAKAKSVDASTFTVDVENGSGTNLLATKNAAALTALGFKTNIPDTTPAATAKTVIEYPSGMEGQAKTVYFSVPGAQVERTSSVARVTLILGANGVQTKTLMPKATTSPSASASVSASAPATTAAPSQAATSTPPVTTAAQGGCIN